MLLRLLLVVLLVTGQFPVRVCTCATSAADTTPSTPCDSEPTASSHGSVGHHSKCRHAIHQAEDSDTARSHTPSDRSAPAGGEHEQDCPIANPWATAGEAVISQTTSDSIASDFEALPDCFSPPVEVPCPCLRALNRQSPPPSVPLFISFLNLRN